MPEFSGLKSGWLKGRKSAVEGWFPVDFVMPVLSERSESRWRTGEVKTECQSADCSNYTNLPAQYVIVTTVITNTSISTLEHWGRYGWDMCWLHWCWCVMRHWVCACTMPSSAQFNTRSDSQPTAGDILRQIDTCMIAYESHASSNNSVAALNVLINSQHSEFAEKYLFIAEHFFHSCCIISPL